MVQATLFHSASPQRQAVTLTFLRYWHLLPMAARVGVYDLEWDRERLLEYGWDAVYAANAGIPYRRNEALQAARRYEADKILFVDSDDLISRRMVDALREAEAEVVRCRSRYVYDTRRGRMAYLASSWGDNMGLTLSRRFAERVERPWSEHHRRPWKAFQAHGARYVQREVVLDPCAMDAPALDIKCGDNRWSFGALRRSRHVEMQEVDAERARQMLYRHFGAVAHDDVFSAIYEEAFGQTVEA